MSDYEYALLRYVHDPVAGEFANIGVVLYDPAQRVLFSRLSDRYGRIHEFFREVAAPSYKALIRHLERQLLRAEESLRQPDALTPPHDSLAAMLADILPEDESCFRASHVMYGVEANPAVRIEELFEEFVTRYEQAGPRPRREEDDIRRALDKRLVQSGLHNRITFDYSIAATAYSYTFHAAWQNGRPQVLEPVSFDLLEGQRIVEKATQWSGRLYTLAKGADFAFTALVATPNDPTLESAYERALTILRGAPNVREVVAESETDRALALIALDTAS